MIKTLKSQYLAILWALLVTVLCDMPMAASGESDLFFDGFDKLVHTGFFFVLTVLMYFGDINSNPYQNRYWATVKILFIAIGFGGGIELSQLEIFTYRTADWWDFFADMTGVGMGVFAYFFLFRRPKNEKSD